MKKKVISALLALALAVGMIPAFTVPSTALAGYAAELSTIDIGKAKPGYYKLIKEPQITNTGTEELKGSNAKIVFEGGNADVFQINYTSGNLFPGNTHGLGFTIIVKDDLPEGSYWSQAILLYDRDGPSSFAYDYRELSRAPVMVEITKDAPAATYTVVNGKIAGKSSIKASQGERLWLEADAAPSGKEFWKWNTKWNIPDCSLGDYHVFFSDKDSSQYMISCMPRTVADQFTMEATYKTQNTWVISFDANGGSGSQASIEVPKGSKLTLPECTFTPPEGKMFYEWDLGKPGQSGEVKYDMTVRANWTDAEHKITVSGGTADKTKSQKNYAVSLTAIPGGSDFTFDGWSVISGETSLKSSTSSSTSFVMPDSDVKISGSYKVNAASGGNSWSGKTNPFADVSEGTYCYDPVLWAYYASPQVTNGIDETHFGPASTVTRGQCVAFLWRAMGEPEPTTKTNPFTDVPEWQYYYKPILWAVEKGITKGTSATTFSPDGTLSTAHIVTFLYRTLGKGSDGWYEEAGNWAKGDGLLDGTGLGVSDQTDCPRGAVVTFLYRELADPVYGVNELSKNDFLMYVEESYNITGRGRVVSGKVQNGSIRTGDKVTLISCDESTKAPVRTTYTVEGIEMFHKLLDEAEKGDNVGILLSAATGTNTPPGSALVNEGSPLKSSPGRFVGTFKRNSDHATKTLTLGDTFQVYWSGYDVTAMLVDLNGGDITPDTTREGVKLTLISPAVFYVGQELTIREGGRTYGTFTVTGIE